MKGTIKRSMPFMFRRTFMRFLILPAFLALSGLALPGVSQTRDKAPDYATIMRGLEANPVQLHSVSAEYASVQTVAQWYATQIQAPLDYGLKTVTNVEWAFKGPKYFEATTDTNDPAQQNAHQKAEASDHRKTTRIFDGSQEHHIEAGPTTAGGRCQYDAVTRPPHVNFFSPLDCGYLIDGEWLATAVKKGHGALAGTEIDPRFGMLSIISCVGVGNRATRLWIAPKFNYMAVRIESVGPPFSKANARIVGVNRCLSAVKVDGMWMPTACSVEYFKRSGGSDLLENKTEFKGIVCKVNKVKDSRFDATMPAGSILYDADARKRYRIGAHGEKTAE